MARTYKGWTRISKDETYKDPSRYFTKWVREGYPSITDWADKKVKTAWNRVDPLSRYEVAPVQGQPYVRSFDRSFARLEDAIFYAETGKYRR